MPIVELYSQRRRRELGEAVDVYSYGALPSKLRTQLSLIISDLFGRGDRYRQHEVYSIVVNAINREHGLSKLSPSSLNNSEDEFFRHLEKPFSEEILLDAIDLIFRIVEFQRQDAEKDLHSGRLRETTDALEEVNYRFRQNGIGYAIEKGRLMRMDSTYLHDDAVVPVLSVIAEPAFQNANREFREAHEHARNGNAAAVLNDCLKAFESTMKVIADERGWTLPNKVSASALIKMCLENGILPAYYEAHMTGLRGVLEGGIPTPRNKQAGHGAGAGDPDPVPEELVRYVLHLTAATILFLVDAHKARP